MWIDNSPLTAFWFSEERPQTISASSSPPTNTQSQSIYLYRWVLSLSLSPIETKRKGRKKGRRRRSLSYRTPFSGRALFFPLRKLNFRPIIDSFSVLISSPTSIFVGHISKKKATLSCSNPLFIWSVFPNLPFTSINYIRLLSFSLFLWFLKIYTQMGLEKSSRSIGFQTQNSTSNTENLSFDWYSGPKESHSLCIFVITYLCKYYSVFFVFWFV